MLKQQDLLEDRLTAWTTTGETKHIEGLLRIQDDLFQMMTEASLSHLQTQVEDFRRYEGKAGAGSGPSP